MALAIMVMAVAVLLPSLTRAGGFSLYKIATSDVGLASAGWAARAQDPATLHKNQGGMSLLQGNQFQGGAGPWPVRWSANFRAPTSIFSR